MSSNDEHRNKYLPSRNMSSTLLREKGYYENDLYPVDISKVPYFRSRGILVFRIYQGMAVREKKSLDPDCLYGIIKSDWDKVLAREFAQPKAWASDTDAEKRGTVLIFHQNNESSLVYDPEDYAASAFLDRNTFDIIDVFKSDNMDSDLESVVFSAIYQNRRFSLRSHDCMQIGDVAAAYDVNGKQVGAYMLGFHGLIKLPEFVQKNHAEDRKVNHGITENHRLKTIDIDKYEPDPKKPIHCRPTGQISYQEAFDQLKDHLDYVGMLPKEYFQLSAFVKDPSAPVPENWRGFNSVVMFGGSEGICLEIYLNTDNSAQSFATGKTLDSSTESFIWLSRIAAECNLMLNGNGCEMYLPDDVEKFLEDKARLEAEEAYRQEQSDSDDCEV